MGIGLALALGSVGGCKKKTRQSPERKVDPAALLPEGTLFVMGLDVAALWNSKALSDHKNKIESSEFAPQLAALRKCKLGPESIERVVLGADTQGHQVLVLRGKNLGDSSRWSCLAKAPAGMPWPSFTLKKAEGQERLRPIAGGGRGLLVDENTVLLSDAFWWPKVLEVVAGRTKPAIEGPLGRLYANAPTQHQLWFRGALPARAESILVKFAPSSEKGVEQVSGGLALKEGLAMELDAVFGSAQLAESAKRELSSWLAHLKRSSPMFGLPKSVMERAKLDVQATLLRFRFDLNGSEWTSFQRNLSRISAGSRDAPKIPDMFPRAPGNPESWKDREKPGK